MSVLSSQQIWALLDGPAPIVSDMVEASKQVQANGVDLTLASIESLTTGGRIGLTDEDRILADSMELTLNPEGYVHLEPGVYLARLNETVSLPPNVMALARPRSSMLRNGVSVHTAVWDAGYHGRSQVQVVVYNPAGFTVSKDARIVQMVFLTLESDTDSPYAGLYQGEAESKT